jgi:hypothetical protein
MTWQESGDMRLGITLIDEGEWTLITQVRGETGWEPAATAGFRALEQLVPTEAGPDFLAGALPGLRWHTHISPEAGGFWLETVAQVEQHIELNPAMILWIGALDNLNDRQAHTWRQTILRAPTVNQQGLPGNDLAAGYLYDHATHTESICYFPGDAFSWAPYRFYNFTVREVTAYHPAARYGLGLLPNAPDAPFSFAPGEHRLRWWFTQRRRTTIPSPWEAQRTLVDTLALLLDPVPARPPEAAPWAIMAERTLQDLSHDACWVTAQGQEGLRAYVRGSSAVGRDKQRGFELMTQLDVLWPLLLWRQQQSDPCADALVSRLLKTLPLFDRPQWDYVANNFPPHDGDSFMDTWYFLENVLIKLPWVAYLTDDETLHAMFFRALRGAQQLAHNTGYLFPLFADASDWQPRASLMNAGAGGLFAAGCVIAHQLDNGTGGWLDEAAQALRVLYQLPPHQLTHEPQQLSFAAASAAYLHRQVYDPSKDWAGMAGDFTRLVLRMAYWSRDPAVPFYDPRGMFQACASLCYPAYKENVEVLIAWPELLRSGIGPAALMAAVANLQRCHNYAFFDPFLPADLRRGPCANIPYEDLATAEFSHTAQLGKELYGAGEVFWSALLFDDPGAEKKPDVLSLCLDVPCVELRRIPVERRYLVYDPTLAH